MGVAAVYNNGNRVLVTNYTIENGEKLTKGQTSVTITYVENGITKTVDQSIIVKEVKEPEVPVVPEEPKKELNIKKYEIISNIMRNIEALTTIVDFFKNIEGYDTIGVFDKKGQEIKNNNTVVGTGMEIFINNTLRYKVAVKSDLSGDGKLSIIDLSQFKLGIVKLRELDDTQKIAADLNNDGKASITDLAQLKLKLVQ